MYAQTKTCPIEASNIANLGSDLEKKIKEAASKCERAWDGAGSRAGVLQIWRIEKFQVVKWPETQLGKFYDGDSYIVLHTYKKNRRSNALAHDVHFWLGKDTTQDEAGTAAYKTVELDDRLGGAPVQHREVQSHESPLFLSYFPNNCIEILHGGVDSGFNHVKPTEYKPRLLHVKGNAMAVRVTQVELKRQSLNSGDVFILDDGLKIYQWNGKSSSHFEKIKAGQVVRALRDERGGKPVCTMHAEGDSGLAAFWGLLGGEGPIASASRCVVGLRQDDSSFVAILGGAGSDSAAAQEAKAGRKMFRLSDAGGKMSFSLAKSGDFSSKDLDTNDVFVIDVGAEIFVWIGKRASKAERKMGMQYAQQYLVDHNRPAYLPISRVLEGGENQVFNSLMGMGCFGGERSRDINFGDDDEEGFPHSCCPHYPVGGAPPQAAPSCGVPAGAPAQQAAGGWAYMQQPQPQVVQQFQQQYQPAPAPQYAYYPQQMYYQQPQGGMVYGVPPPGQQPMQAQPMQPAQMQQAMQQMFGFFQNQVAPHFQHPQ